MNPDPHHKTLRFVLLAILVFQVHGYAQAGPQPPCGSDPVPPYPGLDQAPTVRAWSESDFGRDWRPPACTGWTEPGFLTLVTTAARFRYPAGGESLLRHVGAISERTGVRYWSATQRKWQTLIVSARALTGPQQGHSRQDFTPAEMTAGKVVYLEVVDNRTGAGIYRMRIDQASPDRLVFDVANVSSMHYLFVTLFHPGDMGSIYILDRESNGVWRFYSISRTGRKSSRLSTGRESSSINRAVAFYRFLAGIPTDQEPPAAR
jgi:hypothetical protein